MNHFNSTGKGMGEWSSFGIRENNVSMFDVARAKQRDPEPQTKVRYAHGRGHGHSFA